MPLFNAARRAIARASVSPGFCRHLVTATPVRAAVHKSVHVRLLGCLPSGCGTARVVGTVTVTRILVTESDPFQLGRISLLPTQVKCVCTAPGCKEIGSS